MIRRSTVSFIALLSFAASAAGGEVVLAERGRAADCAIVLPADASPSQMTAADELRDHVEKMTGVRLPVQTVTQPKKAIFLGTAPLDGFRKVDAALGNDGFRIAARPPHLVIAGSGVHGTLFGVYDFLERYCGCEWLSSRTTVVSTVDRIALPDGLDETRIPAFKMRDMNWYEVIKDVRFTARLRLNGLRTPYPDELGGQNCTLDKQIGATTFEALPPSKTHFDAHPEWYAEINGRRTKVSTQPCLSNPELVSIMASNLLARIAARYPTAKYYCFAQNDWWSYCTCARCSAVDKREGSPAGSMIEFLNKMAEVVEKDYPDVVVHTLAYMYTLKPPRHVRARKNVMVILCTDGCDFSKPIETSAWQGCVNFRKNLEGWKRVVQNIYIWDYSANFNSVYYPFPCLPAAQANMRYFLSNGIDQLFEEGQYAAPHAPDAELKCWVLAHLMWDPYQPLEPLLDRFFRGYYGAAASMAREYYDRLAALPRDEKTMPLHMWGSLDSKTFSPEFFKWASRLWERAAVAVADDPVRADNVEWTRNAVDCMRIMLTTCAAPLQVTRHPEYARSQDVASLKTAAKRILADWEREPDVKKLYNVHVWKQRLVDMAAFDPGTVVASDRVEIEDGMFLFGGKPKPSVVSDRLAGDGRAIRIPADTRQRHRSANFLIRNLRFDEGVRYRLRVRARVEATGETGAAFVSGVVDLSGGEASARMKEVSFAAGDFSDDYRWMDVGTWVPQIDDTVWIGLGGYDAKTHAANPAVRAVYIDKIEISRVDE